MTAEATAARTPRLSDPTLGFTLRLAIVGAPIVTLLTVSGSKLLLLVVAASLAGYLLWGFPSTTSTRLMATVLVLAPDNPVAHLGGAPITARTVAFVVAELACLFAVSRGRLRLRFPMPLLTLMLIVAGLLGAAQNNRSRSIAEFAVVMVLPALLGATIGDDRFVTADFLRGLCCGVLLVSCVAIVEIITNHNFISTPEAAATLERGGRIRANAGWAYPTELSALLCLGAFFVVEALRVRLRMIGLVVGGALVTAAVIATQSRSGLLGLVAGAATYTVLQRRASRMFSVLIGLALTAAVVVTFPGLLPSSFRTFITDSSARGGAANANIAYRQELYDAAAAAIRHRPWFGYGYGSGGSVATNDLHAYFGRLTDLASLPVSLTVQLGIVGAVAVALILTRATLSLAARADAPARLSIAPGIVGCVVAMLGVPLCPTVAFMIVLAGLVWSQANPVDPALVPPVAPQDRGAGPPVHAVESEDRVPKR